MDVGGLRDSVAIAATVCVCVRACVCNCVSALVLVFALAFGGDCGAVNVVRAEGDEGKGASEPLDEAERGERDTGGDARGREVGVLVGESVPVVVVAWPKGSNSLFFAPRNARRMRRPTTLLFRLKLAVPSVRGVLCTATACVGAGTGTDGDTEGTEAETEEAEGGRGGLPKRGTAALTACTCCVCEVPTTAATAA